MKKKIDIILVVDCSGSLREQRINIQNALNKMVRSIKESEDLFGCEITFSLILFSEKICAGSFRFEPIEKITPNYSFAEFSGVTNPGPALESIVTEALARYEKWNLKKELCYHPLVFYFTDGYPYHPDKEKMEEYKKKYEAAAKYIKEKERKKQLLIVSGAFGPEADIDNIKKLTSYPERIVKISEKNIDKLENFFSQIIPMTTVTAVSKSEEQLADMFKLINDEE